MLCAILAVFELQQCLPFTVLKQLYYRRKTILNAVLQQSLPFTVLKLIYLHFVLLILKVATALTVYGIETIHHQHYLLCDLEVATVPTVYGIETLLLYGIRIHHIELQQCLPFMVLKRILG